MTADENIKPENVKIKEEYSNKFVNGKRWSNADILHDKRAQMREFLKIQPVYYVGKNEYSVWNFQEFCYEKIKEVDLLNRIGLTCMQNIPTHQSKEKNEILEALKQVSREVPKEELNKYFTQFKDKICDMRTGKIVSNATPEYLSYSAIPWKIGKSEDTPTIDRLLRSWTNNEKDITRFYEAIASTTIRYYPIHSFFILYGLPGTGKGTTITFLTKFLGPQNVWSTSMDKIIKNPRFETINWENKLLLWIDENNYNFIYNSGIINSVTSNKDIGVEVKGGESRNVFIPGKFFLTTNLLPRVGPEDGFNRRVRLWNFDNQFDRESDIISTIPDCEFENLAKKCLRIAGELIKNGKFTGDLTIKERMLNYQNVSKSFLEKFIEEKCDSAGVSSKVIAIEFNLEYNKFLKEHNRPELTPNAINKEMKKMGYEKSIKSIPSDDGKYKSYQIFTGIKLKEINQ